MKISGDDMITIPFTEKHMHLVKVSVDDSHVLLNINQSKCLTIKVEVFNFNSWYFRTLLQQYQHLSTVYPTYPLATQ